MDTTVALAEAARSGVQAIPGVLALRFLPIVGYVLVSWKIDWKLRVAVPAAYAVLAVAAAEPNATPFHWLVLSYAYFTAAAWAAFQLSTPRRTRVGWFVIVLLLFWIAPTLAIDPIPSAFLVVGWELVLAAYSYHIDTVREADRSFRDFLFFLLVNPALVYRNRGTEFGSSAFRMSGAARVILGIMGVTVSFVVANAAAAVVNVASAPLPRSLSTFGGGFVRLLREYAAHSGVASIQIGALFLLGYRIPERYRYPLFARSPAEFWRRWNTYVGDWARTYVYAPLVLGRIKSKRRSSGKSVSTSDVRPFVAFAIIVTFTSIGLLHELFVISTERRLRFGATAWFAAIGCAVVLWEAVARRLGLRAKRSWLSAGTERVLFLLAASYAAARLW